MVRTEALVAAFKRFTRQRVAREAERLANEQQSTPAADPLLYSVEAIRDRRIWDVNQVHYLVKWVGYALHESTWVHVSNMLCGDLIKMYMEDFAAEWTPARILRKKRGEESFLVQWQSGQISWEHLAHMNSATKRLAEEYELAERLLQRSSHCQRMKKQASSEEGARINTTVWDSGEPAPENDRSRRASPEICFPSDEEEEEEVQQTSPPVKKRRIDKTEPREAPQAQRRQTRSRTHHQRQRVMLRRSARLSC